MSEQAPAGFRCAVLGDPIEHSLSPVLHPAAYGATGLEWTYDARCVPEGGLADFLATLDDSWRGLSLTMPLKREVVPLLDEASDDVRRAGAANTVVIADRRRSGHNTDIPGAAAAIRERTDAELTRALVLGGGATATSVGLALAGMGVRHVDVAVRSAARAQQTLEALADVVEAEAVDLATASPAGADIVVSTIPASAQVADLVAQCAQAPVVFEVVYDPWPTPLARAASEAGRVLVGGLDLLVHQAALQFELFTGLTAPLEEMRAAGEEALARRSAS